MVTRVTTYFPEDFPLLRHLHAVIAKDELLNMPWDTFFGAQA